MNVNYKFYQVDRDKITDEERDFVLRISQKFTKIGDFKYRVITFPNGQRARMSEDGTITYPDIKTSRKTQEIER